MEKMFGKSFLGYKENDIENKINDMEIEFQGSFNEYSKSLSQLMNDNQSLKQEIKLLGTKLSDYKNVKDRLADILCNSHIEAYSVAFNIQIKLQDMVNYKNNIVQSQQRKNSEIKTSIDKLLDQIESIMGN